MRTEPLHPLQRHRLFRFPSAVESLHSDLVAQAEFSGIVDDRSGDHNGRSVAAQGVWFG